MKRFEPEDDFVILETSELCFKDLCVLGIMKNTTRFVKYEPLSCGRDRNML